MNKNKSKHHGQIIKMNMLREIKRIGDRGGALIMSFVVMLLLCYASASLVQVRSSDLTQSTDHIQKSKSSYVAMAGIEFAKFRVNNGVDPVVSGKTFADGQFDISKDISLGQITVAGRMGRAKTEQTIDMDFAAACFSVSNLYDVNFGPTGGGIYNPRFKKICHDKVIIDKIKVEWPGASSFQKVVRVVNQSGVAVYDAVNTPKIGTPTTGAQSGMIIDIQDVTLNDGLTHYFNVIEFENPMNAQLFQPLTLTVEYIFKDGSSVVYDYNW